jgi:hypothetical protein
VASPGATRGVPGGWRTQTRAAKSRGARQGFFRARAQHKSVMTKGSFVPSFRL